MKGKSARKPYSVTPPPGGPAIASGAPVVPRRILLVEDHEATRSTLTWLLTRRGHQIVATSSVAEALAQSAQQTFDLVLSDIGLPDGDGCDLMRELRERYAMKGIAMTGYGMEHDMDRTRAAGFITHLTKPITVQNLESAIESMEIK